MMGSTSWRSARFTKLLGASALALLLVGAGCSSSDSEVAENPTISADEDRTEGGSLEALTVTGDGFTANGEVLVTVLMAASGPNSAPYIEETITADGEGEIRYEKRPMPCPQATGYETGSWTLVVARDMASGISGSDRLSPGAEPDCRE